jgi:hypothetical protein
MFKEISMRRERTRLLALGLIAMLGASVRAGDVEPGLKPGDSVGSFNIKAVTGKGKGESFCYN